MGACLDLHGCGNKGASVSYGQGSKGGGRCQDCAWKIFPTRSEEESFPLNINGGGLGVLVGSCILVTPILLLSKYEASLIPSFFLFETLPIYHENVSLKKNGTDEPIYWAGIEI